MPNSKDLKDLDSQLKKTVISAESFKRSSSFDSSKSITNVHKTISNLAGHVRKVVIRVGNLEKTVENNSKKITSLKNISALQGPQIRGTNIGAKLPGGSVQSVDKNITAITDSVSSIAEILAGRKKLADDTTAYERKKSEREKRALAESKLEKRFDGLKRAAEKILSPVKSILDKIIDFLVTVLLGRAVYKLIEWWGDPKNEGKVKSIIKFLTDWGPALLGGFILFGTRFGKGVRILTRIALSGIAKLAKSIPVLLRFARGNPRTALAATAGAYAATQLAGRAFSGGNENTQGLFGGGVVIPRFSGGGFNFGSLFSGIGNFFSGLVSGERGIDKIPAMLTHGEFIMSAGAVQKYGVDTLEAMNAAGGGTNKPKMMSGTVYAQGGGLIGDIPIDYRYGQNPNDNILRRAAQNFNRFGAEDELFKTFKKLGGVPDFEKLVGGKTNISRIFQGQSGADDALDAIRKSVAEKLKAVNNPQSFTQSSRAAAGLDDLAKKFDMDAKTAPRYAENLPRLNTPKSNLRGQFTNLKPDYFLRGQSTPFASPINPNPITQASSFNRYRPGATIRATGPGMERFAELQRFASAEGSLSKAAQMSRMMRLINNPATRFAGRAVGVLNAPVVGDMILPEGTSEFDQRSSAYSDPRLSPYQRRIMMESVGLMGGGIKGGYGLKNQSFKDAPKTQIMTDDRGRPFVGYKAMRKGQLTYIRGPQQAGAGTSNILENLGRMINPGAYQNIDAANARKKYDEAARGSISSLRARGATAATIAKRQAELNKRRPPGPPVRPVRTKANTIGTGGYGGGKGGKPSSTRVPSFSARNPSGMRSKIETLGMMR